jgi:hypothetical protein
VRAGPALAWNARVRAILLAVVLVAVPSIAYAGDGFFVPPMRLDWGPQMSSKDTEPAFQTVAGIHWASLYPKPRANIDVGIGIVVTNHMDGSDDDAAASTMSRTTRAAVRPTPEALSMFGGYVEVATRTNGNGWWRDWVGTRVESGRAELDHAPHPYVGVATRFSTEAFVAGAASASNGGIIGVFAIGFYAELSARTIKDVGTDWGASLGLTMRLPLIAAD